MPKPDTRIIALDAIPDGETAASDAPWQDEPERVSTSSYYTLPQYAALLARLTLRNLSSPVTILDPACGTGALLAAASVEAQRLGIDARLLGWDINESALAICADRVPGAELTCKPPPLGALDAWRVLPPLQPDMFEPLPPDLPEVDCLLMNPPYGQWARLGSALPKADQERLRDDITALASRLEHHGMGAYVSTQALTQWFLGLPALLGASRWGCIMPSIMASSTSATEVRIDLASRWRIEAVVTVHVPGAPNMSEGTAINESIYVFAEPPY